MNLLKRAGKTRTWTESMDNEKSYVVNALNKPDVITFKPEDFSYVYNSCGFRSDEFNDVEILYGGCSFTEGEGLPSDLIWCSQLNKMIEKKFGRTLKLHNLGIGGTSIATVTRSMYWAIEVAKLKPKAVFLLLPSITREEVIVDNFCNVPNIIHLVPGFKNPKRSAVERFFLDRKVSTQRVSNMINDLFRNMLLVHYLCESNGIFFRFGTWANFLNSLELPSISLKNLPSSYVSRSGWISITSLIKDHLPKVLVSEFVDSNFTLEPSLTPDDKVYEQVIARDYAHPGPNPHITYAKSFFASIEEDLRRLYEKH